MSTKIFQIEAQIAHARAKFFDQISSLGLDLSDVVRIVNDYGDVEAYALTLAAQRQLYERYNDEILVDPQFVGIWQRTHDTAIYNVVRDSWDEQAPLRRAWLRALSQPRQAGQAEYGDRRDHILRLLAADRISTRALLAAQLQVSSATISRDLQDLLQAGWVEERGQSSQSGRPQQVLRLSAAGIDQVRSLGLSAESAPADNSAAVAERLFHQSIELAVRKQMQDAQVTRAYSGQPVKPIASPMGTIVPDLIVTRGWHRYVIEAETGKYNYSRIAQKMDRYLTSGEKSVYVITDSQNAPTWKHLQQWLHERTNQLPFGCPPNACLCVQFTTLDRLQHHGMTANIWQTLTLGNLPDSFRAELGSDDAATNDDSRTRLCNIMESEGTMLFWGVPARIPNFPDVPMPEFVADGIHVFEIGGAGDEPEARVIALMFCDDRDTDEIGDFLSSLSKFVEAYVQQVMANKKPLRYPAYPWLYGQLVLVHDRPGEESPEALAHASDAWRIGIQKWMNDNHIPLRVGITHINTIDARCTDPFDLKYAIYDLAGFC